jgi:hypothetical protein
MENESIKDGTTKMGVPLHDLIICHVRALNLNKARLPKEFHMYQSKIVENLLNEAEILSADKESQIDQVIKSIDETINKNPSGESEFLRNQLSLKYSLILSFAFAVICTVFLLIIQGIKPLPDFSYSGLAKAFVFCFLLATLPINVQIFYYNHYTKKRRINLLLNFKKLVLLLCDKPYETRVQYVTDLEPSITGNETKIKLIIESALYQDKEGMHVIKKQNTTTVTGYIDYNSSIRSIVSAVSDLVKAAEESFKLKKVRSAKDGQENSA